MTNFAANLHSTVTRINASVDCVSQLHDEAYLQTARLYMPFESSMDIVLASNEAEMNVACNFGKLGQWKALKNVMDAQHGRKAGSVKSCT